MNLLAYIQGKRKGKEAHRIEKEAMRDPFLADALDGYDEVKADHTARISRMHSRIPLSSNRFGQRQLYIGIAASLLLCLMMGGYFLLDKKTDSLIAMSELSVHEKAQADLMPETDSLIEAEALPFESAEKETAGEILPDRAEPVPASVAPANMADVAAETVSRDENRLRGVAAPSVPVSTVVAEEEDAISVTVQREVSEASVVERSLMSATRTDGRRMEEVGAAKATEGDFKKESAVPMPQIGMEAYETYLKEAMIPLKKDECAQTTGVVEVTFKLKAGRPSDFVITQSFCDAADKEAIRLIENGCNWIGEDGQAVVLKVSF